MAVNVLAAFYISAYQMAALLRTQDKERSRAEALKSPAHRTEVPVTLPTLPHRGARTARPRACRHFSTWARGRLLAPPCDPFIPSSLPMVALCVCPA